MLRRESSKEKEKRNGVRCSSVCGVILSYFWLFVNALIESFYLSPTL